MLIVDKDQEVYHTGCHTQIGFDERGSQIKRILFMNLQFHHLFVWLLIMIVEFWLS